MVAVDVDVYDPTGGGGGGGSNSTGTSLVGRLASQVPRYATIELTDDYCQRLKQAKTAATTTTSAENVKRDDKGETEETLKVKAEPKEDDMEIDSPKKEETETVSDTTSDQQTKEKEDDTRTFSAWTTAEPFAVVDPTLGKISADFDPNKVTFLTLQFDIEKPSTGFCMSSCLEAMTTTTIGKMKEAETSNTAKKDDTVKQETDNMDIEKANDKDDTAEPDNENAKDEQVLVSLQHSLFCAKLFEAIRRELMGDEGMDEHAPAQQRQQQHHAQQGASVQPHHSVVWLASESEENFLPPPSVMVRPTTNSTGAALCVVHCHASEVKVQLDSEYTLRAKLVEANDQKHMASPSNGGGGGEANNIASASSAAQKKANSGSQTPEQLLVLCRSLLLHAQEAYHKHSLHESFAAAQKQREEEEKKLQVDLKPKGLDRIQKKDARKQPKILQTVVGLGTKMLFEQRIRKSLVVSYVVSLLAGFSIYCKLANSSLAYSHDTSLSIATESPTLAPKPRSDGSTQLENRMAFLVVV